MTLSPKVWSDALRLLQDKIPEFAFDAWIRPLAVRIVHDVDRHDVNSHDVDRHDAAIAAAGSPELLGPHVVLGCPSSFHRDRVRTNYAKTIAQCWQAAREESDAGDRANDPRTSAFATTSATQIATTFEFLTMQDFSHSRGIQIDVQPPPRREMIIHDLAQKSMRRVAAPSLTHQMVYSQNGNGSPSARHDAQPHHEPAAEMATATAIERQRAEGTGVSVDGRTSVAVTSLTPAREMPSGLQSARKALHAVPDRKRRKQTHLNARPVEAQPLRISSSPASTSAPPTEFDPSTGQAELPFSFESFVVGPCNALAREASLALARRRQQSLNQLYLGGGSGMGKTHLARATAAEARRHGQQLDHSFENPMALSDPTRRRPAKAPNTRASQSPRVIYTSAEQFTSEFVSAMRGGRPEEWKRRYRGPIGLLIVEDVQFFSGRAKTQLELFHTIQHVLDAGGSVLMTGDCAPRDLVGLDDRMRAQVGRGFVAELEMPDALVRRHILRSKAAGGGVHLPADCLDLLVESTAGSVRDIESMLIQVVMTSSLLGRMIDLELVQEAISLKAGESGALDSKSLASEEIVRIVAAFFGRSPEALAGRSRRRDVLIPRQLAMYLAHRYTNDSFTEIGRSLGRDHPSVRNAIKRIERLVLEKAPLRYQVEALSERIDQALKESD